MKWLCTGIFVRIRDLSPAVGIAFEEKSDKQGDGIPEQSNISM